MYTHTLLSLILCFFLCRLQTQLIVLLVAATVSKARDLQSSGFVAQQPEQEDEQNAENPDLAPAAAINYQVSRQSYEYEDEEE